MATRPRAYTKTEIEMQHNPYQPPKADVESAIEVPRRPISAWILEIVLAIIVTLILIGALRTLLPTFNYAAEINVMRLVVGVIMTATLTAAFTSAIFFIHRGYGFARWLGLVAIIGLGAIMLLRNDTTSYASDAERSGGIIGRYVLLPALLIWWAYSFSFSHKAAQFFSRPWSSNT
jgi:hypothetical protein